MATVIAEQPPFLRPSPWKQPGLRYDLLTFLFVGPVCLTQSVSFCMSLNGSLEDLGSLNPRLHLTGDSRDTQETHLSALCEILIALNSSWISFTDLVLVHMVHAWHVKGATVSPPTFSHIYGALQSSCRRVVRSEFSARPSCVD
jgi:hypothetical protein